MRARNPETASSSLSPSSIPSPSNAVRVNSSHPVPPTLLQHLRSIPPLTLLLFHVLPLFVLLQLTRWLYAFFSTETVAHYFLIFMLLICGASSFSLYPDKLWRVFLLVAVCISSIFILSSLHLIAHRWLLIAMGVGGIFACLILNILSVFSKNPVSSTLQSLCFFIALAFPIIGGVLQLVGIQVVQGSYELHSHASASTHTVGSASHGVHNATFQYGIFASCAASLVNLLFNKTQNAMSTGIPGRDFN